MLLDHGRVRVNVQPYRNLKISFLIEVSFKYSVGVCVCVVFWWLNTSLRAKLHQMGRN